VSTVNARDELPPTQTTAGELHRPRDDRHRTRKASPTRRVAPKNRRRRPTQARRRIDAISTRNPAAPDAHLTFSPAQ